MITMASTITPMVAPVVNVWFLFKVSRIPTSRSLLLQWRVRNDRAESSTKAQHYPYSIVKLTNPQQFDGCCTRAKLLATGADKAWQSLVMICEFPNFPRCHAVGQRAIR